MSMVYRMGGLHQFGWQDNRPMLRLQLSSLSTNLAI